MSRAETGTVTRAEAPVVTFTVAAPADAVLYATVGLGGQAARQGGASVRVTG